jgi:rod shape-determining protein MreD
MIAALLNGWVVRVTLVAVVLLGIQTTIAAEMRPFGVVVQVMLAFAASCGAVSGPVQGAMAGFAVGLVYDLGVGTPLGSTALTMTVAGYAAGWGRQFRIEPRWWILSGLAAVGVALGESGVPLVRTLIGESDVVTSRMLVVVPIVTLTALAIAPVLLPVGRWALRVRVAELRLPGEEVR